MEMTTGQETHKWGTITLSQQDVEEAVLKFLRITGVLQKVGITEADITVDIENGRVSVTWRIKE